MTQISSVESTSEQTHGYGSISTTPSSTTNTASTSEPGRRERSLAIDLLRGHIMVLQALSHSSSILGAWPHGFAGVEETDGIVVHQWNKPIPWTASLITRNDAPGFFFVLGIGIVFLVRSRRRLGWSNRELVAYFLLRAAVLAVANQIFVSFLAYRELAWITNAVLLALAVDLVFAGILCVTLELSQEACARVLALCLRKPQEPSQSCPDDVSPLLRSRPDHSLTGMQSISWHIHNCVLLALAIISISWNHWLSPTRGRCSDDSTSLLSYTGNTFIDFWFYPLDTEIIQSWFPPLAWLSFTIFGILYGRILTARTWKPRTTTLGNILIGCLFLSIFISTRLFHFGNLSEGCLQMPEQLAHPSRNQYLASLRSFLYMVKYPPSVAFWAWGLSMNCFLLALYGSLPSLAATKIPGLLVFGQSPLCFYLLHFSVYRLLAIPVQHWFGHEIGQVTSMGKPAVGVGNGPAFWITYLLGLVILCPCCWWYRWFKSGKDPDSLWRLF